ncbi:hypothetical protein chiPu_0016180 [Chiloscyllium punctatum]|uniref:Mitochondrial assembly of ribosomal large subunit protein 1 n=1 Tax=Chiloscyllium punctatum TaxID=137246 RepID=A0A401T4W4_CHIPU|nr:hypothetical protein [Chiloscyllium punctatum]
MAAVIFKRWRFVRELQLLPLFASRIEFPASGCFRSAVLHFRRCRQRRVSFAFRITLPAAWAMRGMLLTLAAHARAVTRSGPRAARDLGQRAPLHPDPRARLARDARRSCGAAAEPGFIHQPVFNIDVLVALLRQENAKDLCVIKLPKEIKYTDYFVIVSGTSARHLQAMAQYAIKVYKQLKKQQNAHAHIEGKGTDDWKCIDFGNIVVHFMLPETRDVYELEKLWTLRSYDDQFNMIPPETLPRDFIYGPTDNPDEDSSDFRRLS